MKSIIDRARELQHWAEIEDSDGSLFVDEADRCRDVAQALIDMAEALERLGCAVVMGKRLDVDKGLLEARATLRRWGIGE